MEGSGSGSYDVIDVGDSIERSSGGGGGGHSRSGVNWGNSSEGATKQESKSDSGSESESQSSTLS